MAAYTVRIGERTFDVEFWQNGTVRVDGKDRNMSIDVIGKNEIIVASYDRTYSFGASSQQENIIRLFSRGRVVIAEVENKRAQLLRKLRGPGVPVRHGSDIRAPMPGLIVKVGVKEGDQVHPGTSLLILEAMKMENELRCVQRGIVEKIFVKEGTAVEKDELLLRIV
ncbi:MAG: acetyl-CoA carboxylase biotin carboxyl carrier protein subunit [Bacteroidota bacterium]